MSAKEKIIEPQLPLVWRPLFKTPEGRILLLGIALALAGLIVTVSVAYWSAPASRMIGAMSVANIVFGRAVSMSIGYAYGYGHALVVPVNIWAETVLVLLFYPVFVFSMRELVVFPRLGRFLDRMHAAAERHHDQVRRYGMLGLFVFVCSPFWMTGPIGCAIGYLIGFSTRRTLLVVLFGTCVAIAGWAFLMFELSVRTAGFGLWTPILIIGIVIVMILAGYALNHRGRKKQN